MGDKNVLSVSDAVRLASGAIDALPTFSVVGEVSGFRGPNSRSGHCYFKIKDENSSIDCNVWKFVYERSGVQLRDGMEIQMTGSFNVYDKMGSLSFVAKSLSVAGEGLLRQQVALLAKRLEAEGLMQPSRKRKIPIFCERIAVVTSMSGSVKDDVLRTLNRRNPLVSIQLSGAQVQGEGAPQDIIRAMKRAATYNPEVILLVRGGGSYEDLMTFNDEELARYIANCPIPVVTGIGHEPDVTICDMVSDRRTSTPTAAAESIAPSFDEIVKAYNARRDRLTNALSAQIVKESQYAEALASHMFLAEQNFIRLKSQYIQSLGDKQCMKDPTGFLDMKVNDFNQTTKRFYDAWDRYYEKKSEGVLRSQNDMERLKGHLFDRFESSLSRYAASLDALSPLKVLGRGYSLMQDEKGHVIESVHNLKQGEKVHVKLLDGEASCIVDSIQANQE